jgi:NADH dehydrogenase FAD-containing subunit
VALGQRPSTSLLRIRDIKTNDDATINVDPLTLQTNIPGIFAGGDCVTGPNTVVEAVAAGLRATESIDRYLSGCDLRKDRSLERPEAVESGHAVVVGVNPTVFPGMIREAVASDLHQDRPCPFGSGDAAKKIMDVLVDRF